MQPITLYKYKRADGYTRISPNEPDVPYTEMYRLIADEGKVWTNGVITTTCADVESVEGWTEIVNPEAEATEQDYKNALAELGVSDEENNT